MSIHLFEKQQYIKDQTRKQNIKLRKRLTQIVIRAPLQQGNGNVTKIYVNG